MSRAFMTGSRVYGTPKPDSDYDLVVDIDPETAKDIRKAAGVKEGEPVRFGALNLILTTSEAEYDAWLDATAECVDRRNSKGPLTRDEAIAIHRQVRTERKVLHGNPS